MNNLLEDYIENLRRNQNSWITLRPHRAARGQPSSRRIRTKTNTTTTTTMRPGVLAGLVVPAAVYPAPPNHPPLHGPRVHRRSAASPAVISRSTSTRARTQVRPGRSCRARRWSAIGQRRRRSAAVSPCRRHAKQEQDVVIISSRPVSNKSARRRPYPPLPSSPGCGAIGQSDAATVRPRHITFVVAGKRGIGKNTMSYLF